MKVARLLAATTLAFGSLLIATPAQAEEIWWAQTNNEHEEVTITAPDGWQFFWGRAWYGDPNDWACGADVSPALLDLISGTSSAVIRITNDTFTDTCSGTEKIFRFTWGIVPLPDYVEPMPEPSPSPTFAPSPEPSPTPSPEFIPEIIPTPIPEPEPNLIPEISPPVPPVQPIPVPAPIDYPTPAPEPPKPVLAPIPPVVVETPPPVPVLPPEPPSFKPELLNPESLTKAEVAILTQIAEKTLEHTEPGSEKYQEALAQLLVVAEADDPEIPQELAAIPLLGNAAVAVLDAFNSVGNIGADIAPAVREEAQKVVVSSVIVGQIAATASLASVGTSYRRMK